MRVVGDGYAPDMDDNAELHQDLRENAAESDAHGAEAEAQQTVVDRVLSWQVGAEEETIRAELRRVATEVGVEVDDAWVEEKAREISTADPAQG
jgi:hypothetical protein